MSAHMEDGAQSVQLMPAEDGVETEADAELKMIWPILAGANYLENSKDCLQPTQIDKAAGKTAGYYPDFSVWEKWDGTLEKLHHHLYVACREQGETSAVGDPR